MSSIVFDSGPIISLTTNNLLWILEKLREKYNGNFYISNAVREELIEKPLKIRRFKFEALQVLDVIRRNILQIYDNKELINETKYLLNLANNCFIAKGNPIQIVHFAEMSGLAISILNETEAFVVDERNTRLLIEEPKKLLDILRKKLHTNVSLDSNKLREFTNITKNIRLIRSVELVTVAYELGFLDRYVQNTPNLRKTLLEGLLWGVKLNGCSVSDKEINQIIKIEGL